MAEGSGRGFWLGGVIIYYLAITIYYSNFTIFTAKLYQVSK